MKVQILENGTQAKELNPEYKPVEADFRLSYDYGRAQYDKWQQAEESRKVYEIEEDYDYKIGDLISTNSLGIIKIGNEAEIRGAKSHAHIRKVYEPGTIHEAELLENGKIKITE